MTGPIERSISFALEDREASKAALAQQQDAPAYQTPNTAQLKPFTGLIVPMKPKRKFHIVRNRERYKATNWIIEEAQLNG